MLLSLLWCCMRMQECASSPIQTPVEFRFYVDSSSNAYTPKDMVMDSYLNQYISFVPASGGNIFVSKINAAGYFVWSKEYPNLAQLSAPGSMKITNDQSTLRFLGFQASNSAQVIQISTCKYKQLENISRNVYIYDLVILFQFLESSKL